MKQKREEKRTPIDLYVDKAKLRVANESVPETRISTGLIAIYRLLFQTVVRPIL